MRLFAEQRKAAEAGYPLSPLVFAEIVAVDEENRLLKILIHPWEIETGWCRCLADTFYPIPPHKTHIYHADPDAPFVDKFGANVHAHDVHSPHLPQWPYKVGQEVLAGGVRGSNGSEQYVVLGLLDMKQMELGDDPRLTEVEDDQYGP